MLLPVLLPGCYERVKGFEEYLKYKDIAKVNQRTVKLSDISVCWREAVAASELNAVLRREKGVIQVVQAANACRQHTSAKRA